MHISTVACRDFREVIQENLKQPIGSGNYSFASRFASKSASRSDVLFVNWVVRSVPKTVLPYGWEDDMRHSTKICNKAQFKGALSSPFSIREVSPASSNKYNQCILFKNKTYYNYVPT